VKKSTGAIPMSSIKKLLSIIEALRHPETGCPWDLKQTHQSLRPYMIEEAYEAVEAMGEHHPEHLKEELADVLLQVVLHAQLAKEQHCFDFEAIAETLCEKMIRRHPHVFGNVTIDTAEAVTENWNKIKQQEKAALNLETPQKKSAMSDLPKSLPALSFAFKVSERAVAEGFEWPDFESLWACVLSEHDEFLSEKRQATPSTERLEDELGDILFTTVNLARYHKIHPEVALHRATQKFITRYQTMEDLAEAPLDSLSFEDLDALWCRAKESLASTASL
jgi:XTP/dITP diphosphohydrolase